MERVEAAVIRATAVPVNAVLKFIGLMCGVGISPAVEHTISAFTE
jgi:hypothetical protein